MFPNTHHAPTGAAEGAGDETVAGDLGLPELRIGLGLCGVDRAAVPSGIFAETPSVFVDNGAIWIQCHRNYVFLHRGRIVKITLTIHELL